MTSGTAVIASVSASSLTLSSSSYPLVLEVGSGTSSASCPSLHMPSVVCTYEPVEVYSSLTTAWFVVVTLMLVAAIPFGGDYLRCVLPSESKVSTA